jgi:hypothetical protein
MLENYRSVCRLVVMANVVPSSPIFVTLMMEALLPTEMSTRHSFREEGILHSHLPENLKSYIELTGWSL